jgi:predicted transcriptional regulator of viral defense system
MTRAQENKLKKFGLFRMEKAKEIGVSQAALSRLVKDGKISRVERGIYIHPEATVSPDAIGFQIAFMKFGPISAIGGMSALFHYNLIEQVPTQTWVIVPPSMRTKDQLYRLVRTKTGLEIGIENKNGYRIASVERALIEGLKFSSKIGRGTALKAIRTAIQNKQTNMMRLRHMARDLGLEKLLGRFLEDLS